MRLELTLLLTCSLWLPTVASPSSAPQEATEQLIRQLEVGDWKTRSDAAREIDLAVQRQEIDPAAVISALLAALRDDDPSLRPAKDNVLRALRTIGANDDWAPVVLTAMIDTLQDASVQGVVLSEMAAIGFEGRRAVPVVLPFLNHKNPELRSNAESFLARLGPAAEAAIPALTNALTDRKTCIGAASVLGRMGVKVSPSTELIERIQDAPLQIAPMLLRIDPENQQALAQLIRMLDAPEQRLGVIRTLGQIGPRARPAVPRLLRLLSDEQKIVRQEVASALGDIRPTDPRHIDELGKALKDESESVRWSALHAVADIGRDAKGLVETLMASMKTFEMSAQWKVAEALGSIGADAKDAVPFLTKVAHSEDASLRAAAAEALGEIGPGATEAIRILVWILQDTDERCQVSAALALKRFGKSANGAEPFLEQAMRTASMRVRWYVASALSSINPENAVLRKMLPGIVREILEAMKSGHPLEILEPADILTSLGVGGVCAMNELIEALETNRAWMIRESVLVLLWRMGPEARGSVPVVTRLLSDGSRHVRVTAAAALARIDPNSPLALAILREEALYIVYCLHPSSGADITWDGSLMLLDALERIGPVSRGTRAVVSSLAESKNAQLREAARRTLRSFPPEE